MKRLSGLLLALALCIFGGEAMAQIAETGQGPREQTASIGCSIKWKAA